MNDYIDPSEHRQSILARIRTSAANTFEVVAREWFAQHEPSWAQSHSSKITRRLEKDVFPWVRRKPIDGITPPQLLEVIRRIEERGVLETAHRALEILHEIEPLTGHGMYVFPGSWNSRGNRTMARTMLDEELEYRPELVEQQLAHQVRDPNGRAYNRASGHWKATAR